MVITLPVLLNAQFHVAHTDVNVFVSSTQSLIVSDAPSRTAVSDKVGNGKNVRLGDVKQINVFSCGKFVLKVSARNEFNNFTGPEIPAASVYVSSGATGDTKNASDFIFEKDVNLAINNPKPLIHAQTSGTLNTSFNIEYYASGLDFGDLHKGYLDGLVVYTIEVE